MREDDVDYYRKRRQQELRAADRAAEGCSRNVHLELARRYGARLAEATAPQPPDVGMPHRVLSISVRRFSFRSSAIDNSGQEFL
jgi:hypothetical protein